jgi:hypothetical protein
VPVGALQQCRNNRSAQMAAGTTHTDFHDNLRLTRIKMDGHHFVSFEVMAEWLQIVPTGIAAEKTLY